MRTQATLPQKLPPLKTCIPPPATGIEQRGRPSLQRCSIFTLSGRPITIIVTSKGPKVRVASITEVGVEVRARSRKNPAEHFNPANAAAAAFDHQLDFQPSKKIEFHRENFYIQLLEWYGLDHLKAECTELCLKSCTVQSNMFESVGNSRSKSKKAPLVLHPLDQG